MKVTSICFVATIALFIFATKTALYAYPTTITYVMAEGTQLVSIEETSSGTDYLSDGGWKTWTNYKPILDTLYTEATVVYDPALGETISWHIDTHSSTESYLSREEFWFDKEGNGLDYVTFTDTVSVSLTERIPTVIPGPEPSTFLLLGAGAAALMIWRRKQRA